ncbi:hypothetical protein ACFQZI_18930 [Mucilaginibacter lutimaris]|uniref:Uncharacterized protein n=1 Tax=Mucilaginibacter lutimaris TaxID=931629 RepID=A0ABW2ZLR3_9SPHI
MRVNRVQYTTTAAFAPVNSANIAAIMLEVKQLNIPGIKCSCWLLPDGKTFMHLDQFVDDAAHDVLLSLASFKKFDSELWASGLEVDPVMINPTLVASTQDYF